METDAIEMRDDLDRNDEDLAEVALPTSIVAGSRSASALSRRIFFDRIVAHLRRNIAPDLRDFHTRSQGYLLKIHYDNDRVHYEVWPDSRTGQIEIGLHFEDGPVSTAAYLRYFDARIVELKHQLGAEVELERWTASWGHFYHLIPLSPFDGRKATHAAELLTALIDTLEPLVREAGVPRERVDLPVERRRFRQRSRA